MRDLMNLFEDVDGRYVTFTVIPKVTEPELPKNLRKGSTARKDNAILIYGAMDAPQPELLDLAKETFIEQHGLTPEDMKFIQLGAMERSKKGIDSELGKFARYWLEPVRFGF